ncbi:anti-sigma-I factor RsgI6-like isoform X1 [Haliotis cracherodii]|uniref:anti-sigma-I factor RsgI6-like isoform X1 n=2 Tax=Haliotis cracherodii TaxID=6455 RepID=UPI0039EB4296
MMQCVAVFLGLFLSGGLCETNLLHNADFESSSFSHNWKCHHCQLTSSSDSHTGQHSVMISHRSKSSGPSQQVNVTPGTRYFFQAHVKLLTTQPGYLYHGMDVKVSRTDAQGHHINDILSRSPYVQLGTGWHAIGGDYLVPTDTKSAEIFIDVEPPQVDYLMDTAILTEVPQLTNFRAEADDRIEKIRKANVTVRLDKNGQSADQLDVELVQTYSEFITGSAVDSKLFLDPTLTAYRDYLYDNFEWAVPDGFQWHQSESREGHPDYSKVNKTVDILLAHGKKIEGHNLFWDNPKHIPNWLKHKSAADIRATMERRTQEVIGGFKGRVLHWDINNENQHNDFYEQHLQDPNITMWMFQKAHAADPNTKLFLNDFGIVSKNHHYTLSYVDQARTFLAAGVPVYGVGIQSHFEEDMDLAAVSFRLDQVAKVGLPIMIAALNVNQPDVTKKARMYESLYRLYFSHPAVEGITQWHFWDRGIKKPNASLTSGPNVTPNAAGKIVRQLVWGDWRTNQTLPISRDHDVNIRAFKGEYKLRVKHHGKVIREEDFTLGQAGVALTVSLSGSGTQPIVDHILVG